MKTVTIIAVALLTGVFTANALMHRQDKTIEEEKERMFEKLRFLSAEEGAKLYALDYNKIPYLTDLYTERIIPGLSNENILTLKKVYNKYIIHTPASAKFQEMYLSAKSSYMNKVKTDLSAFNNSFYQNFERECLPCIEQSVDSMINSDVQAVVDHAIGVNFKDKKYDPGKIDRVKEKWNEVMLTEKYIGLEQTYINVYTQQLDEFQKSYFESVTKKNRVQFANKVDLSTTLPLEREIMTSINDYMVEDLKEMAANMARDTSITSAELLTDDVAAPLAILYNIESFAYDLDQPSGKELLVASCSALVKKHIRKNSFEPIKRDVRNMIIDSNVKLINDIDNGLKL